MNNDRAVEELAKAFYQKGFISGQKTTLNFMENPISYEKEKYQAIKELSSSLSEQDRKIIELLVKHSISNALFHLAVFFDGASGPWRVDDELYEFVVSIRKYPDTDDTPPDPNREMVEICPVTKSEDLHDVFSYLVDQAQDE